MVYYYWTRKCFFKWRFLNVTKEKKKVVKKEDKTKKQTKKSTKKKETQKPQEGYFKQVRKEMKLVKWPRAKEVLKYTISTIVFCAILCGIFMLLNLIMSIIKGWVG